ncbi:hypothetical protein F5148DRAFT_984529, partial [Russula earlei]
LAISIWLTKHYHENHNYLSTTEHDRVKFLAFCSIWTTLILPICPVAMTSESGAVIGAIFWFLSWVFWLSGAVAITHSLGGRLNCSLGYVYCGQLNALEAVAWVEWYVHSPLHAVSF